MEGGGQRRGRKRCSHLDGQIFVDEDGQGRFLLTVVEDGEGGALALGGTEAAKRGIREKCTHVVSLGGEEVQGGRER